MIKGSVRFAQAFFVVNTGNQESNIKHNEVQTCSDIHYEHLKHEVKKHESHFKEAESDRKYFEHLV